MEQGQQGINGELQTVAEQIGERGLLYYPDNKKGIRRKKHGKGYSFYNYKGEKITDEKVVLRIKSLVIPPAWTGVWISPKKNGHIQATGRDAKGRKQYIYHEEWTKLRNEHKYNRMLAFGYNLTKIRQKNRENLAKTGLPKEKVLAAVVELMDSTGIRIGNEYYAKTNHSFGASTLRKKHLVLNEKAVRFEFIGKSGIFKEVTIEDVELAEVIKECVEIPGYEIFKYFDEDGEKQKIDSDDVNQYLRTITGKEFTSKDFRTWAGTVSAFEIFCEEEVDEEKLRTKQLPSLVKRVAEKLANTPSVCRQHYIHPEIIDKYLSGEIYEFSNLRRKRKAFVCLTKEEISVITILEQLKKEIEMQN